MKLHSLYIKYNLFVKNNVKIENEIYYYYT